MAMANSALFLPMLCFLLLLSLDSGGTMKLVHGQAVDQGAWCVAKPSSSDEELGNNLDYACNYVPCDVVQPGGVCFYPDNPINHASVIMNLYYQSQGRLESHCDFTNSGIVTITDPSYGDCKYLYDYNQ